MRADVPAPHPYARARERTQNAALYKPEPYRPKKGEDLPPIARPDVTTGGRLLVRELDAAAHARTCTLAHTCTQVHAHTYTHMQK